MEKAFRKEKIGNGMKSYVSKHGKNWKFYAGFHKRFQGFGFMWEEDRFDVLKTERSYSIEIRLFFIRMWFDYNRLVKQKNKTLKETLIPNESSSKNQ